MSDHGVVILTGEKLIRWLITPRNSAMLPVFLQKQISLGVEISEQLNSMEDFQDTVEKCFSRDQEWTNTYDNFIKEADPEIKEEIEGLTDIAKSEARYAAHMWNRDYESAAKCLKKTLEKAFTISISTGAWHALLLGMALEFTGDENLAKEMYSRAHGAQKNIPALPSHVDTQKQNNIPLQICEVDRQFQVNTNGSINAPKNIGTFLVHLDGSGTSAQTEESIRTLGQYLGLNSSRPDKEFGTGPDVLWVSPDMTVLCIDAKTGKKKTSNSKYKKEEIGQLSDHVQWVKNNIEAKGIIPIFVGPISSASSSANPPKDFKVIKLDQFHSLANRLVAALNDIASNSLHITLRSKAFEIFKQRGLLWPKCFEDLTCHNLCDL